MSVGSDPKQRLQEILRKQRAALQADSADDQLDDDVKEDDLDETAEPDQSDA